MTDRKALADQNETPEDVATLYSWANLHGAKYRDFSASRAQSRERTRIRVEEALQQERARQQAEGEPSRADAPQIPGEERAAEPMAGMPEATAVPRGWPAPQANFQPVQPFASAPTPLPMGNAPTNYGDSAPSFASPAANYDGPQFAQAPQPVFSSHSAAQAFRPVAPSPQYAPAREPMHEEDYAQQRRPWPSAETRESLGRPAWLASEEIASPAIPPEDTIQGSRERLASRWYALKGVFSGVTAAPVESAPAPSRSSSCVPVLAVFSLAGGVGKTSMVATLGRALSSRGERVLLVDTAAYGLLPFFFGARDQRPGMLRTFTPPGISGDAPIQMIALDRETVGPDKGAQDMLTGEISRLSRDAHRVLIDLATASGATTRRVLRLNPTVLVPVVPDMNSVVSVSSIESFFEHNANASGKQAMPYYVLNNFDPSLPLHLDVREVLREQLGDRLLPFAMRRASAVSEALAEGMTAVDYAPNSTIAEDFASLAGWAKSLAAPGSSGFRGVRWSEQ